MHRAVQRYESLGKNLNKRSDSVSSAGLNFRSDMCYVLKYNIARFTTPAPHALSTAYRTPFVNAQA
jgi:hypothetical protein